jgi:hypothetical protein
MEWLVLQLESDRKKAGYLLYRFHILLVGSLPFLFAFVPALRIPILLVWIPFYAYQVYYKKCPLTTVERRLHREDITGLDPILWLLGLPLTAFYRGSVQFVLSTTFLACMFYSVIISTV